MSSEEEDYMSPAFLEKCVKDVRPGLVKDHKKQREYKQEIKKSKTIKQQKAKAKENSAHHRLQEGLSNPLTSENKGFALLAKMGYKQGESLGKSQTGITEPVGITIKADRTGLGRNTALKNLERQRQEIRKRKLASSQDTEQSLEDFRKRMRMRNDEKFVLKSLYTCQKTCERLDQDENYNSPVMKWFWPEHKPDKAKPSSDEDSSDEDKKKEEEEEKEASEEEEEEVEEYEPTEKLEMLTNYLRTTHRYCHWCGVKYEDDADLETNCPGSEKDDH